MTLPQLTEQVQKFRAAGYMQNILIKLLLHTKLNLEIQV